MADDDQGNGGKNLPAVQEPRAARRQITPVQDAIPLFDTADFEHMGRIASVMAQARLVPECLQGSTGDCLMVVNQARRWNLDPFAVAQCASVVHGRLMWEGKLISAVIESKLKIKLDYHFTGTKGKDDYRVYVSDKPFTEEIITRLEPGKTYRGWRIIDGSVGEWKTFTKSGAVNESWIKQPDMQCRYRGARTWCRAYEAGIMLGIYTPDEFDLLREDFEVVRVEALPGAALTSGFADEPERRPPAAGNGGGSGSPGKAGEATSASAGAAGDGKEPAPEIEADVIDPETGEVLVEPGSPAADEDKGAAEALAEEQRRQAEEAAERQEQAHAAAQQEAEEEEEVTIAPAGEVYMIFGERFGEDEKRQTYKDGEPFSRVTEKGASRLGSFDKHAPLIEKAPPKEEAKPGESRSPASSSGSPGSDNDFPGDRPLSEVYLMAPELVEALTTKLPACAHWLAIKQALRTIQATEAWKEADQLAGDRVRGAAFARYMELVESGAEKTPIPSDVFLFGLWMDFGAKTPAEIDGLFASLMRSQDWPKMTDPQKKGFGERMAKAKARLSDG